MAAACTVRDRWMRNVVGVLTVLRSISSPAASRRSISASSVGSTGACSSPSPRGGDGEPELTGEPARQFGSVPAVRIGFHTKSPHVMRKHSQPQCHSDPAQRGLASHRLQLRVRRRRLTAAALQPPGVTEACGQLSPTEPAPRSARLRTLFRAESREQGLQRRGVCHLELCAIAVD